MILALVLLVFFFNGIIQTSNIYNSISSRNEEELLEDSIAKLTLQPVSVNRQTLAQMTETIGLTRRITSKDASVYLGLCLSNVNDHSWFLSTTDSRTNSFDKLVADIEKRIYYRIMKYRLAANLSKAHTKLAQVLSNRNKSLKGFYRTFLERKQTSKLHTALLVWFLQSGLESVEKLKRDCPFKTIYNQLDSRESPTIRLKNALAIVRDMHSEYYSKSIVDQVEVAISRLKAVNQAAIYDHNQRIDDLTMRRDKLRELIETQKL